MYDPVMMQNAQFIGFIFIVFFLIFFSGCVVGITFSEYQNARALLEEGLNDG